MALELNDYECEEMHAAAVARVDALDEWLVGEDGEMPESLAPYCGCQTCVVREALDAAMKRLVEIRG